MSEPGLQRNRGDTLHIMAFTGFEKSHITHFLFCKYNQTNEQISCIEVKLSSGQSEFFP